MTTQLKERQTNQKGGTEEVVIEAITEFNGVVRISRVEDGDGFTRSFKVYKGERIGGQGGGSGGYRLSTVANRTTMVDAAWDFVEACQKMLGVK